MDKEKNDHATNTPMTLLEIILDTFYPEGQVSQMPKVEAVSSDPNSSHPNEAQGHVMPQGQGFTSSCSESVPDTQEELEIKKREEYCWRVRNWLVHVNNDYVDSLHHRYFRPVTKCPFHLGPSSESSESEEWVCELLPSACGFGPDGNKVIPPASFKHDDNISLPDDLFPCRRPPAGKPMKMDPTLYRSRLEEVLLQEFCPRTRRIPNVDVAEYPVDPPPVWKRVIPNVILKCFGIKNPKNERITRAQKPKKKNFGHGIFAKKKKKTGFDPVVGDIGTGYPHPCPWLECSGYPAFPIFC